MKRTQHPSFGALLRQHRHRLGLTQEELAERAELSVRQLAYLERDQHIARPGTIRRLADALALSDEEHAALLAAGQATAATPQAAPAGAEQPDVSGFAVREASRSTLPQQATPFIGRERDVEHIVNALRREDVRLLTLTGPGGTGKTRLAIQAAGRVLDAFPDGVVFVPLGALTDPSLVASTVAAALELKKSPSQSVVEALRALLREKHLLLILDNFEHLLPAASVVSELLTECRRLTVLVTSRAVLHLAAEHNYAVPPLDVPPPGQLPLLGTLIQYDAVTLFTERARAAKAGFSLTPGTAEAVVEICHRLDGLPLAIELAAARIRLFPPRALLQRLSSRLDLLTGGAVDAPTRQQTLRNTVDWSYSLLSEDDRTLLARLAVFAGGCTFEAAEAVCDPDGTLDVLEGLSSLVDKSLLSQDADDEVRITMLETIREYAAEQLRKQGDEEAIRSAHAHYFLRLGEEAEPGMDGPNRGSWYTRLEHDLDNVRVALRWFLDRGAVEEELRLATALDSFWRPRGYGTEGRRWLEMGLAAGLDIAPHVRAYALWSLGIYANLSAEHEYGTQVLEEALDLFRELGDGKGMARALTILGHIAREQGQYQRATALYEEGLRLRRELRDEGKIVGTLTSLGHVAARQGDWVGATARYEELIATYREVGGDPSAVASALAGLGDIALQEGRLDDAEARFHESLDLAREVGNKEGIMWALVHQGEHALKQGDLDRARERLRSGILLARELGVAYWTCAVIGLIAALAMAEGRTERGVMLKGAEAATRERLHIPVPLLETCASEETMSHLRTLLDEADFIRGWNLGQSMTLDEAVRYALEEGA